MRQFITLLCLLLCTTSLRAELLPSHYRRQVIEYSLALKLAAATTESAQRSVKLTRVAMLPELSAAGSLNYFLRKSDGQRDWAMSLEPRIVQTIYAGGVVRAEVKEALLTHEMSICSEAFTLLEVTYAAYYAYWNLWAMSRLREAMSQYVEIIKSQAEVIHRRFGEGYTSKGDLLMISSRLSEAQYELISAEQSRLTSLHNLNVLRGEAVERDVSLDSVSPDSLFMPERISIQQVMDQRPDYTSKRLNEEFARTATQAVRGAYNPQISGGVGAGWRTHSQSSSSNTTYIDGSLFVELSLPIYHFSKRRKAVAVAEVSERTAELEREVLRDEIIQVESDAWTDIIERRAQMSAATRSLNIASENLSISTYSYNEGLVSIVDLMTAQISWIQNYTNAITAEYDYQIALSTYRRVVGDMGKNYVN